MSSNPTRICPPRIMPIVIIGNCVRPTPITDQGTSGGNNFCMNSILSGVASIPQPAPMHNWIYGGSSNSPSSIKCSACRMCPASKTSISGLTPCSRIRCAAARPHSGGLRNMRSPKFKEPTSREQISGFSVTGSSRSSMMFFPGIFPPLVVRLIRMSHSWRIRSTTSAKSSSLEHTIPVSGSRTWMCAIDAPARLDSIAACAISLGVYGTAGFISLVGPDPTTATETIVFAIIGSSKSL